MDAEIKSFARRLLVLLAVCLWGGFAQADPSPAPSGGTPLDATPAEMAKIYGPVLRHNARVRNHVVLDGGVMDGDLYGKNNLIIRALYIKGRCVLLEYTRANGALTFADVNPLLATNAGNATWELGKDSTDDAKFYHRSDDKAIAHWSKENDGSLLVSVEDGNSALGGNLAQ